MKICIYPCELRGRHHWQVDWTPSGGKRNRRLVSTKAAAESLAAQIRAGIRQDAEEYRAEPAPVRNAAETALAELRRQGLSIEDIVRVAQRQTKLTVRKTLAEAAAETIACRTGAGYSEKYVTGLRQYLDAFVRGRTNLSLDSIGVEEIEAWFRSRAEKPSTRAANLGRLSTMFRLGWERGWIETNPCDRVSRVRIVRGAPRILTVDECQILMDAVVHRFPKMTAWFALTLFAGVRPEEADQCEWTSINLDNQTVVIDALTTKVRTRRIVHLQATAVEWLRFAKSQKAALPIANVTRRRCQRALREVLGEEEWPQDVLRHTAASYWLASVQDAGKVAHELGNSAGVLMRHYREIVTRSDAARFWAIRPGKTSGDHPTSSSGNPRPSPVGKIGRSVRASE